MLEEMRGLRIGAEMILVLLSVVRQTGIGC